MSKRPRRTRPPARRPGADPRPAPPPPSEPAGASTSSGAAAGLASSGAPGAGGGSSGTPRPTRPSRRTTRTTRRVEPRRSAWDRYRGLLLGLFALIGVGLIGYLVLQSSGARAYTCATLMTPGPTEVVPTPTPSFRPTPTSDATIDPTANGSPSPSATGSPSPSATGPSPSASPPAAGATPRIGFQAADLGQGHVSTGSTIDYAYCPPTSGDHYNAAGQGPIRRDFYGPQSEPRPGGWVHNLEHGYIVLAYRAGEGEGPSEAELAEMRALFEDAPPSEGSPSCLPNKMIVLRFDEMSTRFAALAWDRALMMDTLDPDATLEFYEQWVDSEQAPEAGLCSN